MVAFRFDLAPIESISPWGAPNKPELSWFALTWGDFWIELGGDELFRYTPAVLATWGLSKPYADYPIAAFLRDVRSCVGPALAPLPAEIERLAADVYGLAELQSRTRRVADAMGGRAASALHYDAWRWLGEREPWMSYLVERPLFYFARFGDGIQISYDNRGCLVDGVPVWTAQIGVHRVSVEAFTAAVTQVSVALLDAMAARIDDIASGRAVRQAPIDVASLRTQHAEWQREFSGKLEPSLPDVSWDRAFTALRMLGALT